MNARSDHALSNQSGGSRSVRLLFPRLAMQEDPFCPWLVAPSCRSQPGEKEKNGENFGHELRSHNSCDRRAQGLKNTGQSQGWFHLGYKNAQPCDMRHTYVHMSYRLQNTCRDRAGSLIVISVETMSVWFRTSRLAIHPAIT